MRGIQENNRKLVIVAFDVVVSTQDNPFLGGLVAENGTITVINMTSESICIKNTV